MPIGPPSQALFPLRDFVDETTFPLAGLLGGNVAQALDGIWYTHAEATVAGSNVVIDLALEIDGELALSVPGVDDLAFVIGSTGGGMISVTGQLVLGPDAALTLADVWLSLRVPAGVLKDTATGGPASIGTSATLRVSGDWDVALDVAQELTLPECEIAGSGVRVRAGRIIWNFSAGETLPTAVVAGIQGEFLGIAIEEAELILPPEIVGAPQLEFDYCCIGTGGFTGGVAVTFGQPQACQIAGFTVELQRVGIRFQESRLVSGEIAALVKGVDFFDTDVAADLQLSAGGLRIALAAAPDRQTDPNASVTNGLVTLRKPGLIEMTLTAAELRVVPGGGALRLSGTITPLITIPGGSALPGFAVEALTITSAGEVSIEGGWINLPNELRVALGPFGLELTRVGLGTEPNGERWVAFSGGLSLAEGIPISAAVDGLKIRWDANGPKGVELSGIKLALTIEGVLHLAGEMRYDAAGQRFDGAGTLQLIALNLIVSVRIVIGKRADYTYFYLYLMVAPPVGLPIFNTGLAFYGFEALYARNMAPDKHASEKWYLDWYRRPTIGAIDRTKWADVHGGQAFGAGVILGTFPDKGYGVAVKGLLILVLPGPVIMLDARANLLRDPSALALPNSQAIFTALVIYDGVHGTIGLGIEPHYVFPNSGELIDVTGIAEAFYSFNDPRAWHVYLGRREREKRIRARLLSLFEANAYLMLEPDSLELGGFYGYDAQYSVGPAQLTLQAYVEGAAIVSWRPKQFTGDLHLQGTVGIAVAGVGLGVSASATVAAQAPQPFVIDAEIKIRADLPWPIPDLEESVHLHWEASGPPRVTAPLQSAGIVHPITTTTWSLEGTEPVVSLDARPSIAFDRPVNDLAHVGENALAAPDRAVGEYVLRANLTGVELWSEENNVWVPYATPNGTPRKLYGAWQVQAGDSAQGNRRLVLWSRTPYEWARPLTETSIGQLEEADRFDPCDPLGDPVVVDFDDHPNELIAPYTAHDYYALRWTPGAAGARIVELAVATTGRPVGTGLPKPYYRCLHLPDQFGFAVAPSGTGGSAPPASGGMNPAPHPALRIELPAGAGGVAVLVLASGGWSIEAFDAAGASLSKAQTAQPLTTPFANGEFRPMQLSQRAANIRRIDVECGHRMAVLAVDTRNGLTGPQKTVRRAAMQQMLDRYKGMEPVLDPNRRYKLRVTTTVVEPNGKSLAGAQVEARAGVQPAISGATCTFTDEFLFRTEGPPGDTALTPTAASPDSAPPLDTLEAYVRQVLPPRGAPAAYRSYDIRVGFNSDYVTQMYLSNGQSLKIELRADDSEVVTVASSMGPGREIVLRREEHEWISTLQRSTCQLSLASSAIVRESTVDAQFIGGVTLAPRRRYDALVRGDRQGKTEGTRPLLQWSFIGSAFLDFADHFRLNGKVRSASLTATGVQWLAQASGALAAGDPWQASGDERSRRRALEVAAFEALVAQVNVERALPAAVEMAAIVDGGTTWAMLLSSPEPFDWDRLQLALTRRLPVIRGVGYLGALFRILRRPTSRIVDVPQELRVLRDADGTRALLLAVSAGAAVAFVGGDYTLAGTFKRDAGARLPILTKGGSAADEHATIGWTLPVI
jgi:hypothetical protein